MPSNLDFDNALLLQAQQLGGFKYKKDAVNAALEEYVRRRQQKEISTLYGSIDYDPSYDYKKERAR